MPANGWSLGDSAFGIVTSTGAVNGYLNGSGGLPLFASWDPGDPTSILAGRVGSRDLVRFGVSGTSLQRLDNWRRTPDLDSVQYSPDGGSLAWQAAGFEIRVRDLSTGADRSVHAPGHLVGWAPSGKLLVSARHGRFQLADPRSARVTPFLSKASISRELPRGWHGAWVSTVSWSTDGRFFSGIVWSHRGGQVRTAIAVGTAGGRIRDVVRLGRGTTYATTWSPSSDAFAYLLSGDTRLRAGVFDVTTGRRTTVAADLSSWWPPAWSPDGRWLLIDDQQHSRWVFAASNGSGTRIYPELGSYPRWGGSAFASPSANVRIPYC